MCQCLDWTKIINFATLCSPYNYHTNIKNLTYLSSLNVARKGTINQLTNRRVPSPITKVTFCGIVSFKNETILALVQPSPSLSISSPWYEKIVFSCVVSYGCRTSNYCTCHVGANVLISFSD